jgi:diaminopimelate epimerase
MKLSFVKMHGLGNDFVVLDGIRQSIDLMPKQLRLLADRHFGVGCDQILLVEQPDQPDVDFRYRIFNADGGEVEQCGNGARCFVRFVHEQGLTAKREIRVETMKGVIIAPAPRDDGTSPSIWACRFTPAKIPFVSASFRAVQTLRVADHEIAITAVGMGNPHAVQVVDDVDTAPVERARDH